MTVNVANVVNAYTQAAGRAGKPGLDARVDSGGGDFAKMVEDAVSSAGDAIRAGEQATVGAMTGKAELTDIITAVSNAELTLQTVVAVRDRIIQAYQEIIRMPI